MAKTILEFDHGDDYTEMMAAIHAMDWKLTVEGIDTWLRNALKYGHDYKTPNEALEAARRHLHDEMAGKGIDIV
jgi:hypothetical protein